MKLLYCIACTNNYNKPLMFLYNSVLDGKYWHVMQSLYLQSQFLSVETTSNSHLIKRNVANC